MLKMDARDRNAYPDGPLIGGRERRRIVIVDYDPSWPLRYGLERDRVRQALDASAVK